MGGQARGLPSRIAEPGEGVAEAASRHRRALTRAARPAIEPERGVARGGDGDAAAEITAGAPTLRRAGAVGAGGFKYTLIAPAVFIIAADRPVPVPLLRGRRASRSISLRDQIHELLRVLSNYARLLQDRASGTRSCTPLRSPRWRCRSQLVLGLLLAHHFLEDRPLKRLFVALLIIPSVISPMVAGSMWRLMFDDRYGPINQIIGWIAGRARLDPMDHPAGLGLSGDHHLRRLAVDAVHVHHPAGGAGERRSASSSTPRRSTGRRAGRSSATSACRRSGR